MQVSIDDAGDNWCPGEGPVISKGVGALEFPNLDDTLWCRRAFKGPLLRIEPITYHIPHSAARNSKMYGVRFYKQRSVYIHEMLRLIEFRDLNYQHRKFDLQGKGEGQHPADNLTISIRHWYLPKECDP